MKKSWLKKTTVVWMITAMFLQLSSCSMQKQSSTVKLKKRFSILGLGDSITEGSAEFSSYLFPLDSMLKRGGYDAMFIGPRRSVQNGNTIYHAGTGGKTAEYIAAHADSIYSIYPADLVLLHSGHNHFVEESPVAGILAAHRTIIQTIRKKNPSAIILEAGVITSGKLPKYAYIPDLNISIKALVDSLHDPNVIFVDQQRGWDWSHYTISDKVHPNRKGAQVIALKWFGVIKSIMKKNHEHESQQ